MAVAVWTLQAQGPRLGGLTVYVTETMKEKATHARRKSTAETRRRRKDSSSLNQSKGVYVVVCTEIYRDIAEYPKMYSHIRCIY